MRIQYQNDTQKNVNKSKLLTFFYFSYINIKFSVPSFQNSCVVDGMCITGGTENFSIRSTKDFNLLYCRWDVHYRWNAFPFHLRSTLQKLKKQWHIHCTTTHFMLLQFLCIQVSAMDDKFYLHHCPCNSDCTNLPTCNP